MQHDISRTISDNSNDEAFRTFYLSNGGRLIVIGSSGLGVGDRVILNGTAPLMVVEKEDTSQMHFFRNYDNAWIDDCPSIPDLPNGPKKTKKKGERFKPSSLDRLAQSKAAKYGR